jgi:hypothetical protein
VAVAAVKVIVAVEVPELLTAPVNEVDPQPLVVGVDKDVRMNFGSTSAILSEDLSGAFSEKVNEIGDAVDVSGFAIIRLL